MEYELGVKVRGYKKHTVKIDSLYTLDQESSTVPDLNLYVDRDVYLTLDAAEELKKILSQYTYRLIDASMLKNSETTAQLFFKKCYADGSLSFEKPEGQYFVIYREDLFERY